MTSTRPAASVGPDRPAPRVRRPLFWILLVVFLVVPIVEIYVLVQVGQVIGALWTIALLIASSVLGGWIIRREGARAWRSLQTALQDGRMPATEIADGVLVMIGGALMLAPGLVTDVVGLALILPLTRPLFRTALAAAVGRRMVGGLVPGGGFGTTTARRPGGGSVGPVVRGEVVDDDRDGRTP